MEMEQIKWVPNRMPKSDDKLAGSHVPWRTWPRPAFHSSFPQYSVTPLANLKRMATCMGLGGIYVGRMSPIAWPERL